jgi:hypothetical protein
MGPQGLLGPAGKDGLTGAVGPQGPQGVAGPQGVPGNPSSFFPDENSAKTYLAPRTLWCADGAVCKVPAGKTGLDWGGASVVYANNALSISSNTNISLNANGLLQVPKSQMIEFGSGYTKQGDAGKIGYGAFDGQDKGTLNIVGAGATGSTRIARVWDALQIGGWFIREDPGSGRLLFQRNINAGVNDGNDQPTLQMTPDGNFWVSRKGRGWMA